MCFFTFNQTVQRDEKKFEYLISFNEREKT